MMGKLFGRKSRFLTLLEDGYKHSQAGEYEEAIAKYQEAEKASSEQDRQTEEYIRMATSSAMAYFSLNDYRQALPAFVKAVSLAEDTGHTATKWHVYAALYAAMLIGQYTDTPEQAPEYFEKGLNAILSSGMENPSWLLAYEQLIHLHYGSYHSDFNIESFLDGWVRIARSQACKEKIPAVAARLLITAAVLGTNYPDKAIQWVSEAIEICRAYAIAEELLVYGLQTRADIKQHRDAENALRELENEYSELIAKGITSGSLKCKYTLLMAACAHEIEDYERIKQYVLEAVRLLPTVPKDFPIDRTQVDFLRAVVEAHYGIDGSALHLLRNWVSTKVEDEQTGVDEAMSAIVDAIQVLWHAGRHEECKALILDCDSMVEGLQSRGPENCESHCFYIITRNSALAMGRTWQGLPESYIDLLEHLDDINKLDTPTHAWVLASMGDLMTEMGEFRRAHMYLCAAENLITQNGQKKESQEYASLLIRQARLALKAENRKMARVLAERAQAMVPLGEMGWLTKRYCSQVLAATA